MFKNMTETPINLELLIWNDGIIPEGINRKIVESLDQVKELLNQHFEQFELGELRSNERYKVIGYKKGDVELWFAYQCLSCEKYIIGVPCIINKNSTAKHETGYELQCADCGAMLERVY